MAVVMPKFGLGARFCAEAAMTPVTCSFFFFLHLLPASKQFDCHPLKNQPFVSLIFNAMITHLTFLVSSLNPIRWR
jgi:hypothetical protein